MNSDEFEQMLAEYFRPAPIPAALAGAVVRRATSAQREANALLERLAVQATPRGVSLIRVGRQEATGSGAAARWIDRAHAELREYVAGQRTFFSVQLDLSNAPAFQVEVLNAARRIPFGEARAYAWVAEQIGNPRAVRAVGTALGRNPVPFLLPCHRVLKSDGTAGGYIFGTAVKEGLLALERRVPVLEGCTTTRIVCRVGCSSGQRMKPEHRVVFASVDDAASVGYRPCRVCRPQELP